MTVGTTRIVGKAGPLIDVKYYLAANIRERMEHLNIAVPSWSYGTGAGKVNSIFSDTRTLADGANETLDLYASGTLVDVFGAALTMASLKLLYVKNNSADASLLVFGGNSVDIAILSALTTTLTVKPGGYLLWIDPSAAGLVLTTNKNLKITHDGTGSSTMDVDVVAMGLD